MTVPWRLYRRARTYIGHRIRGVPHNVAVTAGRDFSCGPGAFFRPGESIAIGNDVFIGRNVHIAAPCEIRHCVMLASYVGLVGGDHPFETPGELINGVKNTHIPTIVIGEDVWVGHGAILLAGVIIGRGAIVAAGSVVTKNIPPCTVWGGVPAIFIRHRFNGAEETRTHLRYLEQRFGSWPSELFPE